MRDIWGGYCSTAGCHRVGMYVCAMLVQHCYYCWHFYCGDKPIMAWYDSLLILWNHFMVGSGKTILATGVSYLACG